MAWEAGWQSPLVVRISNDSRQARCSKQGSWVPDKVQEVEIFPDALGLPYRMPNRRTEPTSFHKPETAALGGYQEHGDSDPRAGPRTCPTASFSKPEMNIRVLGGCSDTKKNPASQPGTLQSSAH